MKRIFISLLILICGTSCFAQKNIKEINLAYGNNLSDKLGTDKYLIDSLVLSGYLDDYSDYANLVDLCNKGRLRGIDLSECNLMSSDRCHNFYAMIPDYAFYPNMVNSGDGTNDNPDGYRTKLQYITLPPTIDIIGEKAFAMTDLKCITIAKTIREIRNDAFKDCKYLKKVTIKNPNASIKISEGAFAGIQTGAVLFVPEGGKAKYEATGRYRVFEKINEVKGLFNVKAIEVKGGQIVPAMGLKEERYSLDSLTVTGDLKLQDFLALRDCIINGRLSGIDLSGCKLEKDEVPDKKLDRVYKLNYLSLPNNIKRLGSSSLSDTYFYYFSIPNSVTEIGSYALYSSNIGNGELVIPEGVKKLEACTLFSTSFESLYLPSTLDEVGERALEFNKSWRDDFDELDGNQRVYINRTTPPLTSEKAFSDGGAENAVALMYSTLYVPLGAKAAYEDDDIWNKFRVIIETAELDGGTSGIKDAVQDVEADGLVEVYTTDGRQVHKGKDMPHLGKGMYVVKENGKVRKIAVK